MKNDIDGFEKQMVASWGQWCAWPVWAKITVSEQPLCVDPGR